ncbi:MAG TPA: hypothetical protein VN796_06870 [Acidimicrobiales bacterium]|nr:hypothetical protein [Acidimicrobiales bacterium]
MNVDTLGRENLRQVSHLHRDSVRGWSTSTSWLWSPTSAAALVIGVVTLVLRLSYGAARPTDLPGARDVLGSGHFDVTRGSPPAPGSWLYVAAGHAVHVVTGLSPVHSLVLLAAVASAGAAALTCVAGTILGGRWVGIAAGGIVASAPVAWFAGSTVSPYSVDAFLAALLVVLARRARPDRAHGLIAVGALGLGAGVRLSVVPEFCLLAVIAVVASTRTVGQLLAVVVTAVGSVAVWFVPVAVVQRGGLHAWVHAVHVQLSQVAHASSVFVAPASGALTNIGTFGGWTIVTLGPVLVVSVVAVVVLAVARVATRQPSGNVSLRIWGAPTESGDRGGRPWYQGTGAILLAALVPPVAVVTLGQFAAGGAVLSYLVPATVLLLLPVARLLHHRARALRRMAAIGATLLVTGIVAVNVQRFVAAPGIVPASVTRHHRSLWISQLRYQSPYADTADTIRAADGGGGLQRP